MAIITVDCDEVLADTTRALLTHHNNTFCGIPLLWEEISNYHFEYLPKMIAGGLDRGMAAIMFNTFIAEQSLEKVQPLPHISDILFDLKRQGHTLYVITARNDIVKDVTLQRLDIYFPTLFQDVILTNYFTDAQVCKGDICQSLGAACMIDDNLIHAEKIAAHKIPTIMPAKPWNAHYDNGNDHIIKVHDHYAMREALAQRGFL